MERDSPLAKRFPLRPPISKRGQNTCPNGKKSHDGCRRGLDSKALSALETPGPKDLATTPGAHAAQKAVNLLILTVMRLERTLQPEHPLTGQEKTHANYTEDAT